MKTLKLMMAAALTMAAFGAGAVTTNRVTVTSTAGTSSVAGSLAYYVKNAPKNGNVLEITIPFNTVCLLDEPLDITSEQSIIIRGEEDQDPETTDLGKRMRKLFPSLGGIALTHTLYVTGDNVFQVVGFLRLEDIAVFEDESVGEAGDSCEHCTFFNYSKLELHHVSLMLGSSRHYRSGSGFELLYGSSTIIENSILGVGSDKVSTISQLGAEGLLIEAGGGRLTLVNSYCTTLLADIGIVISGTDTQSLFVNCDLGGDSHYGCAIKYKNITSGKHFVVGSQLGCCGDWNYTYDGGWLCEDSTSTRYQVVCEGSGRPTIRSSVFQSGERALYEDVWESGVGWKTIKDTSYGTFVPTSGAVDCINCIEEDPMHAEHEMEMARNFSFDSVLIPMGNSYLVNSISYCRAMSSAVYNPLDFMIERLSYEHLNQGAQIWHDADWRNVVGEDTERFVIRGSAEKAVTRLDEDYLGTPIPAEIRPMPFCIQWDEPTLVVNEQGFIPFMAATRFRLRPQTAEALAERPYPKDYALDIWRTYFSAGSFIMGVTSLDDAIAYAREDWRGERKLLGSDGYYHITFADNMKGATIDISNVTGIDEGLKIVIEGNGETLDAHGASGIFLVEGGELLLKNLTLKGARADGPFGESVARPTSPLAGVIKTIEEYFMGKKCGFSDEYTRRGAAVQVIEDSESGRPGIVTIENCRFEDCLAKEGGAIYLENNGCSVTVRNSSFVQCGVCDAASGKGGAIAAAGESGLKGKLTLQDVVFAECGGGETFNDVINLGAAFEADMTGVVMSGGAHGGIYVAIGAALTLNNSVIAGNGGYDFSGMLGSVQGSNVYYGSRMSELWGADFTQVNDPSTVIGSTVREKTVRGVQQAYYDIQVNLPPAPPVTCTVTFASNGGTAVAAQTVAPGGRATRPADPTALGYVFDGWYVDKDFKKAYDFATAVNFDLTLYAKWNQLTAKVVVEDGGATLRFVFDTVNYGTKGTDWFSVADAEAIDPVSGFMPWAGCASSVTKVIFDSSFADCRSKHCGGWFWYFSSLVSVEGLENLDVSMATSLARMFMGCSSLTSLDLAGFDTSCVTDMRGMFYGCTSLKRIAVGDKFVTTSVTASDGMFYDCTALVGGAGTAYDSTKTDKTYARIDGEGGQPGYFTRGYAAKGVAGEYGKWTLPDLGIEPPAAGTVYSVKAYGLPSGLKLKYNAAKKDKKGKVIVKAKTDWWIEGVPTAALDAKTNPMYLAVTVGKKTTWYPIAFSVRAQKVTDLGTFTVGTAFNETGWIPGLAGGGWSVSGLPKGLKYTANIVYKDPKKKSKGIKYAADTTYGKLSAAGLYTITAKKKKGGFYETLKFRVLVNPAGEFTTRNFTAYETFATMKDTSWKAVSGLPAGLKFTAKKYTVSGKITKAGTFAVTFTPKKGKAWTEMWIVAANPAGPALGFNTTGETSMSVLQGQKGKLNEITFPADGTVSVSGLPKGMKLVKNADGTYALGGVPSVTGTFFVTVKATKNGQTVTQRVAVTVKANPLKGTYYGYSVSKDGKYQYRTASLTIAASGKATLKYTEGSKTYTLTTAAGEISGSEAGYRFVQKADTKKKIPARTVMVGISFTDTIAIGDWAACAGTVWDYPSRINEGGVFKVASVSFVNALRTDPETGFASKATYVLTSKADPAEVIYATYAYSSSTGKFTVKGMLPRGKAFSATVSAVTSGNLMLAPISAVDADGTRYLLLLTPGRGGEVRVDGFDKHAYAVDSLRFDFGTGYTALPTTFASAIANTSLDYMPVSIVYSSGEKEAFCVRANGTKYFQVSFDEGATWGAKAEYKYDKARGLITLSFTNGKTKYALDLLYAQPELLYGQIKRQSNPKYDKKTKKTTYTTEYGAAVACFVL